MIPDDKKTKAQLMEEVQELRRRIAELEATLKKSERTLIDVHRLACMGSWVWDIRTGEVEWSAEVYRIFGLDREAFHPEIDSVMNRFHPDDRKIHETVMEQAIANHQQYTFEARILMPDSSIRSVISTSEGHYDENGDLTRISGIVQDVTERKRAEEELRKYREHLEVLVNQRTTELQAKNRELETFAYSVSHDLKAPLRGIDGYSRLLLEDYVDRLDEDGRMFLHNIRHAAKQMNQLIEDLLTYSRLERQTLKANRLNLQTLIQELLAERASDINERHVRLTINIPFEEITTDAHSLTQVLRNLLDNALKFTHTAAEPQIEIGGRETADGQRLWVRDNGIGFDMQYHDRIFDIFQRLHRAEDFPGTGIGLAIVRKALERLGGRTWAESKPDAGATFYLEFRRLP